MSPGPRSPATKISAVVSDVDGTLVTDDKILTARTRAAVARLRANRIAFAIVSSRPPRGLRMLIEPLAITTPVVGFNGGLVTTPTFLPLTQHVLAGAAARQAVEMIEAHGVQAWIFCGEDWLARRPGGQYATLEQYTVGYPPTIVEDFGSALDIADKVVGVSEDFALLTRLEQHARATLTDQATIARSQPYYVDFTHPLANKGAALSELARLLAVPESEIAVIGDGGNDIAMFARSGLSIAMGNAGPQVQAAADFVTDRNGEEGFAKAMERFVLGSRRLNAAASSLAAGSRVSESAPRDEDVAS
jgi:Cof subfamily protein (haloacid dehalogenase superfamily)